MHKLMLRYICIIFLYNETLSQASFYASLFGVLGVEQKIWRTLLNTALSFKFCYPPGLLKSRLACLVQAAWEMDHGS